MDLHEDEESTALPAAVFAGSRGSEDRPDRAARHREAHGAPSPFSRTSESALRVTTRPVNRKNRIFEYRLAQERLGELGEQAEGDLGGALHAITELIARTLKLSRVSVWTHTDDRSRVCCLDLFERHSMGHSLDSDLPGADVTRFLEHFRDHPVIAANVALHDPLTQPLVAAYLEAAGITSVVAGPIRSDGEITGMLLCEHIGPCRAWLPEDLQFAATVSHGVSRILRLSQPA